MTGIMSAEDPEVVLEVQGVGYRISVGAAVTGQLGPVGTEVFLHISHQVRQESQTLYGFLTSNDREAFEILLKIHKIGPAMAQEILNQYSLEDLRQIIAQRDLSALSQIKGVGKATAERLFTELKNKLDVTEVLADLDNLEPSAKNDAAAALMELGYSSKEILASLKNLDEDLAAEEMLRLALENLAPQG